MAYQKYKFEDYKDRQYGYFTVIAEANRDKRGKSRLLLKCNKCGEEKIITTNNFKRSKGELCQCASKHTFLDGLKRNVCGVYKVQNPNGEIYIGQSRNMRTRWRGYTERRENLKGSKIVDSLLNYGVDNHVFSVIHQLPNDVTDDVLWKYEELYIQCYRECNAPLLNIREGGFSNKHSQESINKMKGKVGKWMLGRKIPIEVIEKGLATRKKNNKPTSQEAREKIRSNQLGSGNSMAKLSNQQVLKIIELRETQGDPYKNLAAMFGVSISCISNIFNRGWGNIYKNKNHEL